MLPSDDPRASERDELQTRHNNLTVERDGLLTTLANQRARQQGETMGLQNELSRIKTNYNAIRIQVDKLQREKVDLQNKLAAFGKEILKKQPSVKPTVLKSH